METAGNQPNIPKPENVEDLDKDVLKQRDQEIPFGMEFPSDRNEITLIDTLVGNSRKDSLDSKSEAEQIKVMQEKALEARESNRGLARRAAIALEYKKIPTDTVVRTRLQKMHKKLFAKVEQTTVHEVAEGWLLNVPGARPRSGSVVLTKSGELLSTIGSKDKESGKTTILTIPENVSFIDSDPTSDLGHPWLPSNNEFGSAQSMIQRQLALQVAMLDLMAAKGVRPAIEAPAAPTTPAPKQLNAGS